MKIAVGKVSQTALKAIEDFGGGTELALQTGILIVQLPVNAKIQSYGGTGEVQDAYITLETGDTLRYTREWNVEACSIVLVEPQAPCQPSLL